MYACIYLYMYIYMVHGAFGFPKWQPEGMYTTTADAAAAYIVWEPD